jgi:hypothetical protein
VSFFEIDDAATLKLRQARYAQFGHSANVKSILKRQGRAALH